MEPIKEISHWVCPKCGWKNPYDNHIILTYPPTFCYKCKNCDYHYDYHGEISSAESFRDNHPDGMP